MRQILTRPSVYLDTWAIRMFAEVFDSAAAAQGQATAPVNDNSAVSMVTQLLAMLGIQTDDNGVIHSD